MYERRELVIATMHKKEDAIAPVLEKVLGVNCIVPKNIDTDQFGTFSGEIERKSSPLEAARMKCYKAMDLTGCDLAVASEGSFGPHPSMFFIPADDELLVLIDKKNNIEIVARELSTETNFNAKEINSIDELKSFAAFVKFPSHALILKVESQQYQQFIKGISDWEILYQKYFELSSLGHKIFAETDMRALYNPSRMSVIQKATQKLVKKIKSICPQCKTPGFGITDHRDGLPCSLCGFKTRSTLSYISVCQKCSYTKEDFYPNGKTEEDPMYCDMCNP